VGREKSEGELRTNLRVKWREVEEGEDLDIDGWKMWRGICGMKVKKWQQKAVDREEWASVTKEAKALRGVYSQGESMLQ
jgi:hypothetical protein